MKKLLMMLALLLAGATVSFGQFYHLDQAVGTTYVYETETPQTGTIKATSVVTSIEGNKITYMTTTELPMNMGQLEVPSTVTVEGNKVTQDVDSYLDAMKKQMGMLGGGNIEMDLEGDTSITYINGKVGEKLPLSSNTVTMNISGMPIIVKAIMTKNEIVAEEEITTPAGTFDTLVLEIEMETITSAMGQTETVKQSNKLWIAKGKGLVKQVTNSQGQSVTLQLIEIK